MMVVQIGEDTFYRLISLMGGGGGWWYTTQIFPGRLQSAARSDLKTVWIASQGAGVSGADYHDIHLASNGFIYIELTVTLKQLPLHCSCRAG
jgi:hypothetical protein